ncbi:Facilitated trehalose transporter Tret1 [Armadillidium vulgare]|nr:Facilitated trehalose transporter Tret1 [Armadillidium vulgare]
MFDIICVPLVALLSEPYIRGLCGALPELTTSFGILFVFLTFSYFQDTYSILIDSIPVFLGFLGSFFVPESPYWLLQRGKEEEARKSIARVVGPTRKGKQEELFLEIKARYETIETSSKIKKLSLKEQVLLLRLPQYWKPIMLSIAIFGFREFGGNNILFFYAITIFKETDIEVDIFISTIIVSVARVLSTFLSASIQDKFGRRKLLIGTLVISALCLIFSGCVLFFEVKVLKVLPLIGITVFILMTGIGMGPIPFIIIGEIMPSDIKFLGTAIVYSLFNLYQFLIVNVTPSILRQFSVGTIFISFSIFNFIIAGILYFILPETKRKTFSEIESMFK